jgi:hypothetical protein
MKHLFKLGAAACALGALFAACSSTPQNSSGTNGAGAGGAGSTGSTGSQSNNSSSSSSNNGGANVGGSFVTGSGTGMNGGTGGTMECAGTTSKAELIPLDIYLMLDSSGSMTSKTGSMGTGPTKWDAITQALSTFFTDPASAGLGVGLQHFPLAKPGVPATCTSNTQCINGSGPCYLKVCSKAPNPPCATNTDCPGGNNSCINIGQCADGTLCAPVGGLCPDFSTCKQITQSFCVNRDSCMSSDYATPAVEIDLLNAAAGPLNAAISGVAPDGSTPTAPALQGAIDHAKAWATAHPTHEVVVLFATDGLPTECTPTDIPSIAQLAAAGLSGTPSIKTFAIGVFASADLQAGAQTNLDQIAAAGGTQAAFIVDTSMGNVEQAFLQALNAIRGTKLACEYAIPPEGDAGALDYNKVNVQYTPSGSAMPQTIGYVGSLANCDPMKGGWYYDADPAMGNTPTKIIMCPATCTTFGQDLGGQVDIQVGCQTVVQPPPK